ncbi:MAG: alpha/beta hydrolase [Desulforhopalus sp.]
MVAKVSTRFLVLIILILLAGCQPRVYLMPPPVSHHRASQFYSLSENNLDDNLLYTLYATNRRPYDKPKGSTGYTIFPSDTLELGYVVHSVGDEGTTWDDMLHQSLNPDRDKKLLLKQIHARDMVRYGEDDSLQQVPEKAEGFYEQINRTLQNSFDSDLLVYVHGANSNFYRATAQGAQLFHYTGHNAIVLSFSWPSAENILKYKTDVLHAKKTVPAFSRLIELLAYHTKARNINILAYSAGAQVVAPGLAYFRELYPDMSTVELKKKLRLGEIYFAAPDTSFKPFIHRYLKFKDIVERTTINFNKQDKVLRLAAFQNRTSRLGRPDISELDEEESRLVLEAALSPQLNILDVGRSEGLELGGAHDFWYNHPWVSNDLLLLLLFNADPVERGLELHYAENGAKFYRFPSDYDRRIEQILLKKKEAFISNVEAGLKVKQ